MWLLLTRQPKPDAAYWPGRRVLAALDAVAWPALWLVALSHAPVPTGAVGLGCGRILRVVRGVALAARPVAQRTLSLHDMALGRGVRRPARVWSLSEGGHLAKRIA